MVFSLSGESMRAFILIIIAALASCTITAHQIPPETGWTVRGVVTDCHDGDTVTISVTHKVRVRLLDCWSPEVTTDKRLPESRRAAEKAAGIAARDHLKELALGKEVVLQVPLEEDLLKATTMGRVLGTVWLKDAGKSLNEIQVESGHATKEKREELH